MTSRITSKNDAKRKGGKEMADNSRSGYAGKIKNTGTQIVEAVYKAEKSGGKSTVKTGTDLRSGK